ncbi:uncharacterized protein KY384_006615 [Bacidia gigantensis]|uniref:uncharacterized protein n=1 Tax=Bacidia gigantensis TaxID=2732470 RepID=UPI001D0468EF|nr:uncharacterized protein KY384_006615 [Bacidia gigantensis]KAG8528926.1 hypothetical protein KY384_006615 [Bacidia gigantensis]
MTGNMATIKSEDLSAGPTNCVDPLDIEQYLNPETISFSTPSVSPTPSSIKSSIETTATVPPQPFMPPPAEQVFSGPSHQYEQYRQQSSLPVGAVASTFALNESSNFYDQDPYDMIPPHEIYYGMNSMDDYIDFGSNSGRGVDMDMDFNTPPSNLSQINDVSPTAVGDHTSPQSSSSQHVRAWPGMHQQAAQQAKAQAEAQQQREEQSKQQSVSNSRASSSSRQSGPDPHVEESISRLLNRMRHSSVSSSQADDQLGSNGDGRTGRTKKDEEDMDEDERLLASEEGKKLSSKERRQLRNKVSARAFRSRRKEYIGQLEEELASKVADADRFRIKNEQLVAENTRLTDLTRMLLSSPHFSNFLEELSATGGAMPSLSQSISQRESQQRPQSQPGQQMPKDANPNSHQHSSMHVGLAMIPEEPYESTNPPSNAWGPRTTGGYDQQVYAVTSLPEEPLISTSALSGKSIIEPLSTFGSAKDELPEIEAIPGNKLVQFTSAPQSNVTHEGAAEVPEDDGTPDIDESDPVLSLYADHPTPSAPLPIPQEDLAPEDRIFGNLPLEKGFSRLELLVGEEESEEVRNTVTMIRFARLRAVMTTLGARVDALTGHL